MAKDLAATAKAKDIKYFLISFVDLLGQLRAKLVPANLLDAIRLLDSSKAARTAFGNEFIDSYVKLKNEEWQRFTRAITPWERDHTLDC